MISITQLDSKSVWRLVVLPLPWLQPHIFDSICIWTGIKKQFESIVIMLFSCNDVKGGVGGLFLPSTPWLFFMACVDGEQDSRS